MSCGWNELEMFMRIDVVSSDAMTPGFVDDLFDDFELSNGLLSHLNSS